MIHEHYGVKWYYNKSSTALCFEIWAKTARTSFNQIYVWHNVVVSRCGHNIAALWAAVTPLSVNQGHSVTCFIICGRTLLVLCNQLGHKCSALSLLHYLPHTSDKIHTARPWFIEWRIEWCCFDGDTFNWIILRENVVRRQTFNINRTKSKNVSRLVLQLSLPNPLKPGV